MRKANRLLVVPVTFLFGLACVPRLDPFRGHRMDELERQERELREAFPEGIDRGQAEAILRSRHIEFSDVLEDEEVVLRKWPEKTIRVRAGDRVVSASFPTEAWQFPCGYDLQVVLVFGEEQRLNEKYVSRFPTCP